MHSRKKIAKIALGLLAGLGVVLAVRARAPVEAARAQPPAEPGPTAVMGGYLGTGTCAASGCHGGVEPKKTDYCLQDEYTQWMAHDKHTQAFSVLQSDRAWRMARNLAPTNPEREPIPPYKDTRCLACHTIPQLAVEDAPPEAVKLREQGVGCEACHGPAWGKKPWLVEHTAPARWREAFAKNPDDPKWKDYGFIDLSDLPTQAQVCAGCHVGAPEEKGIPPRDVNHDLMAAGHPRLNFELTTYRANMPPHWNVAYKKEERKKAGVAQEDFVARVWAAGQVGSARAALDLLKDRAERAEKNKAPWPEFAEYRCFACHASLTPEWRREPGYWGDRKVPGSFPLDPWYRAMLPGLIDAKDKRAGYAELEAEMALPTPREERVLRLAESLSEQHATWLKDNLGKVNAATVRKGLAGLKNARSTWESATQLALAAAALEREAFHSYLTARQKDPSATKPEVVQTIDAVLEALAFPEHRDSPEGIRGSYGLRKDFQKPFETLLDALKK